MVQGQLTDYWSSLADLVWQGFRDDTLYVILPRCLPVSGIRPELAGNL
jgi:hypothetical protein